MGVQHCQELDVLDATGERGEHQTKRPNAENGPPHGKRRTGATTSLFCARAGWPAPSGSGKTAPTRSMYATAGGQRGRAFRASTCNFDKNTDRIPNQVPPKRQNSYTNTHQLVYCAAALLKMAASFSWPRDAASSLQVRPELTSNIVGSAPALSSATAHLVCPLAAAQ